VTACRVPAGRFGAALERGVDASRAGWRWCELLGLRVDAAREQFSVGLGSRIRDPISKWLLECSACPLFLIFPSFVRPRSKSSHDLKSVSR
jgi:hypothetical protein